MAAPEAILSWALNVPVLVSHLALSVASLRRVLGALQTMNNSKIVKEMVDLISRNIAEQMQSVLNLPGKVPLSLEPESGAGVERALPLHVVQGIGASAEDSQVFFDATANILAKYCGFPATNEQVRAVLRFACCKEELELSLLWNLTLYITRSGELRGNVGGNLIARKSDGFWWVHYNEPRQDLQEAIRAAAILGVSFPPYTPQSLVG